MVELLDILQNVLSDTQQIMFSHLDGQLKVDIINTETKRSSCHCYDLHDLNMTEVSCDIFDDLERFRIPKV